MALSTRAGANHDWETEALRTSILREAKSSDLPVQSLSDLYGARCRFVFFDLVPTGTATVKTGPGPRIGHPSPLRETELNGWGHNSIFFSRRWIRYGRGSNEVLDETCYHGVIGVNFRFGIRNYFPDFRR
jgi:hypothetical protein